MKMTEDKEEEKQRREIFSCYKTTIKKTIKSKLIILKATDN